eukprot:509616-Rhodomonas_salina.2
MVLRVCYAVYRTEIGYGDRMFGGCYAVSGTEIGYAATQEPEQGGEPEQKQVTCPTGLRVASA